MNTGARGKHASRRLLAGLLSLLAIAAIAIPGVASAYDPASPLNGWHDGAEDTTNAAGCTAFGWAVAPGGAAGLEIRVLADDDYENPVATGIADQFGQDMLDTNTCEGGYCRFSIPLWGALSAGESHRITVQAKDPGTGLWWNLEGTGKTLSCWGYPEGFHDGAEGSTDQYGCVAFGWASDPDDRERDLQVQVLSDGAVVASSIAELPREDLAAEACPPDGTCAWSVDLSGQISPDADHVITAQAYDEETDSWMNLEGTGKTLNCSTPAPWFTVFPQQDVVEGWDWPLGTVLQLTVDDPATPGEVDFAAEETVVHTPWESWQHWVWFDLSGQYDLKPGDVVTVSGAGLTQTHVVQPLSVYAINVANQTVLGAALPGTHLTLWSWEDPVQQRVEATANAGGIWSAHFEEIGFDLLPGYTVRAEVWDEFGNDTAVDVGALTPPRPPMPVARSTHFRLPADAGWADSGMVVEAGIPLYIGATGEALTAPLQLYRNAHSGPAGQPFICSESCSMDNAPFGALIGRIGQDGEPFLIGSKYELVSEQGGVLYVAVNDGEGTYDDNAGGFLIFFTE